MITFEEAAREVHRLILPTWRNPKRRAQFLATLETCDFSRIGATPMTEVSSADVLAMLSPIWTTKAKTARRAKQRIGTVMKWNIAQGWRKDNPAETSATALPRAEKQKAARKALR